MAIDVTVSHGVGRTAAAAPTDAAAELRARVQVLAEEFESLFLLQMIRQMRQSMLDESAEGEGLGRDEFLDSVDQELARSLSRAGGLGLDDYLMSALAASGGPPPAPGSVTGPPAVSAAAAGSAAGAAASAAERRGPAGDAAASVMPIAGAVTSPFGWRADPFHGRTRFHSGVDIRAAYGREVPAVADGRVTFAGERGGYGNLVIVEHANGFESRYAHLASLDVVAGQRVDSGVILGRVGQTGRATAPHLHFEMLRHGERLDPGLASAAFAGGLKNGRGVDDLPLDRPPGAGVAGE
jgi:murein DD-endopeptidase MepM/ murein hydrolase activator NlpD